jgi:hypothetical protein
MAVIMKNVVFWDIKTQFVPHRRHITSPLHSSAGGWIVRFEIFMAVTMKNAVYWNVTPCGSCKNRRVGTTYRLHYQGDMNRRDRKVSLVTANVHSSPILVTLMMEVIRYCQSSDLTRATWRNISQDRILHSHRHEHLTSYTVVTGWTL